MLLLNDPAFLEAARGLAESTLKQQGDDPIRISFAFARILSRPPEAEELKDLVEFVNRQEQRFRAQPNQAKALMGIDPKETTAFGINILARKAAFTALGRMLFNLDETVVKR